MLLVIAVISISGCGYNAIQQKDEAVKAGWSEVLNQYKRRADLIPNLVTAFTLVTTLAAVLFMFVWSLILLAWLAYRRTRPERHAASVFRLPGGRWVCYGVLAFFAAVLVLLTLQDDTRQALLASPLWFLLLGVGYWWRGRRQACPAKKKESRM